MQQIALEAAYLPSSGAASTHLQFSNGGSTLKEGKRYCSAVTILNRLKAVDDDTYSLQILHEIRSVTSTNLLHLNLLHAFSDEGVSIYVGRTLLNNPR